MTKFKDWANMPEMDSCFDKAREIAKERKIKVRIGYYIEEDCYLTVEAFSGETKIYQKRILNANINLAKKVAADLEWNLNKDSLYFINNLGEVDEISYTNPGVPQMREFGNIFNTREEAEGAKRCIKKALSEGVCV